MRGKLVSARQSWTTPAMLFLAVLLQAASPAAAQDEERILSFHSLIRVNEDASLTVTETIKVRSTGAQIKHGIYRDFPTDYRRWLVGPRTTVGFEVLDARRDGAPEQRHLGALANGKRVYLGREDVLLPPGGHTYELTYRTDRQLHFSSAFDELYWNVTGNDWAFPIDEASATVVLPRGASGRALRLDGFTGPKGSTEQALEIISDQTEGIRFRSRRKLSAGEGLTIVVNWPKGYVPEPRAGDQWAAFFRDNRGTVAGPIGLLLLLAFYLMVWSSVGRDPAGGTLVPMFTPPSGLSPAAMRYIRHMGFDDKTVASALVSLAVKGYLTIEEADGVFTLRRGKAGEEVLSPEDIALVRRLFGSQAELTLAKANHLNIKSGLIDLKRSLKNSYEKIYFLTNRGYFLAGVGVSMGVMLATAVLESTAALPVAAFMSVWLTGWSFGVTALLSLVFANWKAFFRESGAHRVLHLGGALFTSLFSLPFLAGEVVGLGVLTWATSAAVLLCLLLTVVINAVFYGLLKAPTLAGRKAMDQIEGFKLYLSAAESDRLSRMNPEGLTPKLFEKYLPYAMALDVEEAWTERFAGVLSAAAEGEYRPAWYSGSSIKDLGAAGFTSSIGSSLGGAFTSSSSAPGSSGSGGGGSSGGGGGGGGGGGW